MAVCLSQTPTPLSLDMTIMSDRNLSMNFLRLASSLSIASRIAFPFHSVIWVRGLTPPKTGME